MWGLFLFALRIALGLLLIIAVLRFLNSTTWDDLLARGLEQLTFVDNLEPTVNIVGFTFVATWLLRFWEQLFPKSAFSKRWGLLAKGPFQFTRFFTSPLIHRDYGHLRANTPGLLLFMGMAILVLPSVSLFVLATVVLLLVEGVGTWRMGKPGAHGGASGLVLGYYSFDVFYSLFVTRTWWGILLGLTLLLWRGRRTIATLRYRDEHISAAGHAFGLIGGIISAAILSNVS